MNFSNISSSTVMGKLLRLPLKGIPSNTIIPILQGHLRGSKWIVGAGTHGCWLGSYELEKQSLFVKVISTGKVVYDIGANVGFYTLLASKLVGEDGIVYAFEPLEENLQLLKKHIQINQLRNVIIIPIAISDVSGDVHFSRAENRSQGKIAEGGEVIVKSNTIDNLVEQGIIRKPDYIKIDIEGAELAALNGAKRILAECDPEIFLATHSKYLHEKCSNFLINLGYHVAPINNAAGESTDELYVTKSMEAMRL